MEDNNRNTDMILLLDDYSRESELLHTSFKLSGIDCRAIVTEPDGFLPEDAVSVYELATGSDISLNCSKPMPRCFYQVDVPEFWEISSTGNMGKVHELNRERARIYYAEPKHKRMVRLVEWLDDNGVVRLSEQYNKYGNIFAKTIYNSKGEKVNRTFFTPSGKEVIHENHVTGSIILTQNGIDSVYRDKTSFITDVLVKSGYKDSRYFINSLSYPFFCELRLKSDRSDDVLFWQEDERPDVPGNMETIIENKSGIGRIIVQKEAAFERLCEMAGERYNFEKLGFVYPFKKENTHGKNILICTNSDQIIHLEDLIKELPDINFHVAAITEMSSELMRLDDHKNVKLYPGAKQKTFDRLFMECDIYLDINRYDEIVDAVFNAFLHDHMMFAFKEVAHKPSLICNDTKYAADDWMKMAADIRKAADDKEVSERMCRMQKQNALAQTPESFKRAVCEN